MSARANSRTTRASNRATSTPAPSQGSPTPEAINADARSTRAGSAKPKRAVLGTKDSKTYGSKVASAKPMRMAPTGSTAAVAGIESAIGQAHARDVVHMTRADSIHEENEAQFSEAHSANNPANRVQTRRGARRAAQVQQDQIAEEMSLANDDVQSEDRSAVQRQLIFSDTDTTIDLPLSSLLRRQHYMTFATFVLILALLFADIYRGPLLGPRLDLLKNRHLVSKTSSIVPLDVSNVEQRFNALEHDVRSSLSNLEYRIRNSPSQSPTAMKPRKINFFSHLHRLAINELLTSPTGAVPRWCDGSLSPVPKAPALWQKLLHQGVCLQPIINATAQSVFAPWAEDTGPSWCAAAGDAKLQLATYVQGPMTPTELVVEYNPRTNEIHPKRVPAPKAIELWMEVAGDDTRESIGRDFEAMYGPFEQHSNTGALKSLPREYVPIGRWTYSYHSENHIQTFSVVIDLKAATTSKLVIRVNSNWAEEPFTCLYRLKLHGIPHHSN
ncbi:MAG: hypothetical protein Q9220_002799 [cf. Caloplaca sp. 1 TL-2023]